MLQKMQMQHVNTYVIEKHCKNSAVESKKRMSSDSTNPHWTYRQTIMMFRESSRHPNYERFMQEGNRWSN